MTNKNGQSVISTYSYSYNYDGNISKSVENGVTKNYKYDPMNRLVQENTKNNTYSYTYDNAGNRATMTATGSENFVKSYVYDKNNRLLEECKDVNNDKYITNYQYDNNGNTIEKVKSEVHSGNTGTQSLGIKTSSELPKTNSREYFKYNVFNQLSTYYSTTIGKYTTYKYLSNGYRCYKNVKGIESYFIWDGDEIGAEYDANGNVTDVLYRGNNLVKDSKGNNYVYDSHGSITSILNDNGSKSKEYEYDAFGNIENETNSNTYNPWQYCGEYTDQESGLIYLRNRYYDSETGRFINEDPARSGGNWYSYCSGNPVMFWDPTGLLADATYGFAGIMMDYMNNCWRSEGLYTYIGAGDSRYEIPNRSNSREVAANNAHKYFEILNSSIADDNTPNAVQGIGYNNFIGIAFSGGHKNLCWAYCDIMMYYYYNPQENYDAVGDVEKLAKSINGGNFDKSGYVFSKKTDYNVSFDNVLTYLQDGPTFAIVNRKNNNGEVNPHSIVITAAYKYKGVEYIKFYDPNYGNTSMTYNDMTKDSSSLKLTALEKPDEEKIKSIGGIL